MLWEKKLWSRFGEQLRAAGVALRNSSVRQGAPFGISFSTQFWGAVSDSNFGEQILGAALGNSFGEPFWGTNLKHSNLGNRFAAEL